MRLRRSRTMSRSWHRTSVTTGPCRSRERSNTRPWSGVSTPARRGRKERPWRSQSTRAGCTSSTPTRGSVSTTRRRGRNLHEAAILATGFARSARLRRGWGGGEGGAGAAGTTGGGAECGSGTISLMGIWVATEQKSIQAVLDGFEQKCPDISVKYTPAGDNIVPVLATAVQGGNPPDLATIAQPGTIKEYADSGKIKPIDFAKDTISANYSQSAV